LIDQIVDGTLTPAELRAAIDSLERIPDGWKRCAAAFLEAQCWRESFRALGEPALSLGERISARTGLKSTRAKRATPRWVRGALAAGIALASFTLGWLGRASRPTISNSPAARAEATATLAGNPSQRAVALTPVVDSAGPDRLPAQLPADDSVGSERAGQVRTVARLLIGDGAGHAEVPILAGPGITEEWIRRQPPPVSEHGQIVFQRHGYQVDQRRRLISGITADGRRVTVPVDHVLIRYTGNQSL
jgi:hypothetical protein